MIDLEIPEGFKVKGFDFPLEGEYILMTSGEYLEVTPEDQAYNYPGIILEKEWEPEVYALYEFSDDEDFNYSSIRKFYGFPEKTENNMYRYVDIDQTHWIYMRPVRDKLGK